MTLPHDRERLLRRENDIATGNLLAAEYRYAREFAEADEILIGAPYWDCFFPTLLKLYLEQICVNGITIRSGADGRPIKICADTKLVFITTIGGYLCENSSLKLYWKEFCGLLGIQFPKCAFIKRKDRIFRGMIQRNLYKDHSSQERVWTPVIYEIFVSSNNKGSMHSTRL